MLLSAAGGLPGAHLRTFLRRGPRLGPRAQVVGMAVRRGRDIELPVPLLWVRPDTLEEAVERDTWGVPQPVKRVLRAPRMSVRDLAQQLGRS